MASIVAGRDCCCAQKSRLCRVGDVDPKPKSWEVEVQVQGLGGSERHSRGPTYTYTRLLGATRRVSGWFSGL